MTSLCRSIKRGAISRKSRTNFRSAFLVLLHVTK
jgi:hypothetical protein